MFSKIILYAEEGIANKIKEFSKRENEFKILYVSNSYETCVEKAAELGADIILFQLTHPVYKIQDFFHDIAEANISPTLFIFNVLADNEIIYSITSSNDHGYQDRLKHFFTNALGEGYRYHFSCMRKGKIMDARINSVEKTEYLKDILRGVTYNEFVFYKEKMSIQLNDSGYYVYIWNLTEIEYPDHDLNKNIYYLVGEELRNECQEVLNAFNGGEVFYINPTLLCMIINDDDSISLASKHRIIVEITSKLKRVTWCKTAVRYISSYIKKIESVRSAYDTFQRIKVYKFFCREAEFLSIEYINSIKKEVSYPLIDNALRDIKELIYYDITNPKLIDFIRKLFLGMIKPSLSYHLYYYCFATLSSALNDKYNGIYNETLAEELSPYRLLYSSIEQKCNEFIESIHLIIGQLYQRHTIKNSIIYQAIEFIHEHYNEDITVNQIASNLHISYSYLSQIFKKELGINIIQYIITYRIQKAKELLSSGEYLISTVANSVGFFEVKHFSKTFKKVTGLSPMQFKKENLKDTYV